MCPAGRQLATLVHTTVRPVVSKVGYVTYGVGVMFHGDAGRKPRRPRADKMHIY
jgi:hypothetical protein